MKLQLKKIYVLVLLNFICTFVKGQNTWCWTQSMTNEAGFKLNSKKGGINWGICKEKPVPIIENYIIKTKISNIPLSGTSGQVLLTMFGTKGNSKEFNILNSKGCEDGDEIQTEINTLDVGDLQQISIKLTGNDNFRCEKIDISTSSGLYSFECNQPLSPCVTFDYSKCISILKPAGDTQYEINIQPDSQYGDYSYTIALSVIGENGQTSFGVLSHNGTKKDENLIKKLYLESVGDIIGFEMRIYDQGRFDFDKISITNKVTSETKDFEIGKVSLFVPGNNIFVFKEKEGEEDTAFSINKMFEDNAFQNENEEEENNEINVLKEISQINQSTKINQPNIQNQINNKKMNLFNINDANGGVMNHLEKKNIIDLECDQTLENPMENYFLFGPQFINKKGNYMNFIVRCPGNCHLTKGTVEGVGIHPETTPICLAALIDKAISYYGGILSISVFPGLSQYSINNNNFKLLFPNIELVDGSSSSKSYTLAKIDNVDLYEKDYRILNSEGKLSTIGRPEIRINGAWGSLCGINDDSSAIRFCRDLGYASGVWMNANSFNENDANNDNFCESFEGKDYCRAEGQRAFFKSITCSNTDYSISSCNKEIAEIDDCPRTKDAIIKCDNLDNTKEITIQDGVIKLENIQQGNNEVIGRVEMYVKNKGFLPICDAEANQKVANVICKQMGFNLGKIIEDTTTKNSFITIDEDIPNFAATEIVCNGKEKRIKDCKMKRNDIKCLRFAELVIACEGDKGDYTGASQYLPPPPPLPSLGKLGLNTLHINCDTTFEDDKFKGDVGSIFSVVCPTGCKKINAPVIGIGIYRSDSSICKAAIHSGVIFDTAISNNLIIAKENSPISFEGMERNEIISLSSSISLGNAFSIFQMNSGWKGMNKIYNERMGGSYLELEYMISSSFIQFSNKFNKYPSDAYHWIEPQKTHIFTAGNSYLDHPSKVSNTFNEFSIFISLTLSEYTGKRQFIFSSNSCGGFNIYLENDGLYFGDPCNSEGRVNTELILGENDNTLIYAYFSQNSINAILIPKSYGKQIPKKIRDHSFSLTLNENIGIGRPTENDKMNNFEGKIDYIFIYDKMVQINELRQLYIDLESDKYIKKEISPSAYKRVTKDNRDCISECISGPTPNDENGPTENLENKETDINIEKDPQESLKVADCFNCKKDYNSVSDMLNNIHINKGKYEIDDTGKQYSTEISCNTDYYDPLLEDSLNRLKYVRVRCPNCLEEIKEENNLPLVFGTKFYHPKSSICIAALHQGINSNFLKVSLKKGFNDFNGSLGKNKIESLSTGKSDISFIVEEGIVPIELNCEENLESSKFIKTVVGMHFLVKCPKNCNSKVADVYGTNNYAATSSICMSAIHAGEIIQNIGGEVELIIQSESTQFEGSRAYGILSKSSNKKNRVFSFLNNPSSGASEMYINCNGNFSEKWLNININKECSLDGWKYSNMKDFSDSNKKNINYISFRDNCSIKNNLKLATIIILKKSQLSKGMFDINFKMDDYINPIGFIFGYNNINDYNSINIIPDINNAGYNVALISVKKDKEELLRKASANIQKGIWYTCRILLNKGTLSLYIYNSKSTEKTLILNYTFEYGINGMVGLGINGNKEAMFSNIKITGDFEYEKKKERTDTDIEYYHLVKDIDKKIYNYFLKLPKIKNKSPYSFCSSKCGNTLKELENIRFYSCIKTCISHVNAL